MANVGTKRERAIRSVLRKLAAQRVVQVLQPGNVWVVELAPKLDPETEAALRTCWLRGWVELISHDAVPRGDVANLQQPDRPLYDTAAPIYRLTDSGWNVIHSTRQWLIATFAIAAATLVATIISVIVTTAR
jgi:hypothetical protein